MYPLNSRLKFDVFGMRHVLLGFLFLFYFSSFFITLRFIFVYLYFAQHFLFFSFHFLFWWTLISIRCVTLYTLLFDWLLYLLLYWFEIWITRNQTDRRTFECRQDKKFFTKLIWYMLLNLFRWNRNDKSTTNDLLSYLDWKDIPPRTVKKAKVLFFIWLHLCWTEIILQFQIIIRNGFLNVRWTTHVGCRSTITDVSRIGSFFFVLFWPTRLALKTYHLNIYICMLYVCMNWLLGCLAAWLLLALSLWKSMNSKWDEIKSQYLLIRPGSRPYPKIT